MESLVINELIDVGAVFKGKKIKPKWFVWNNRKYLVKEITYIWQNKCGEANIIYFAVTDGATLFELSLNQKSLVWRLEKTTVE